MSEKKVSRPIALGVTMIIVGTIFLGDRLGIIDFSWPFILIIIGAALGTEALVQERRNLTFASTLLILLGFIFLGDKLHWFGWRVDVWPMILIAIGLSLIFNYYINREKAKGSLVGGLITGVIGMLFLMPELKIISSRQSRELFSWWPLILVGIGLYLILKKDK